MPPEHTAVGFRVAQNSHVSARAKVVSLSFKSICRAIRLKFMIDVQPFRDLFSCPLRRFGRELLSQLYGEQHPCHRLYLYCLRYKMVACADLTSKFGFPILHIPC